MGSFRFGKTPLRQNFLGKVWITSATRPGLPKVSSEQHSPKVCLTFSDIFLCSHLPLSVTRPCMWLNHGSHWSSWSCLSAHTWHQSPGVSLPTSVPVLTSLPSESWWCMVPPWQKQAEESVPLNGIITFQQSPFEDVTFYVLFLMTFKFTSQP